MHYGLTCVRPFMSSRGRCDSAGPRLRPLGFAAQFHPDLRPEMVGETSCQRACSAQATVLTSALVSADDGGLKGATLAYPRHRGDHLSPRGSPLAPPGWIETPCPLRTATAGGGTRWIVLTRFAEPGCTYRDSISHATDLTSDVAVLWTHPEHQVGHGPCSLDPLTSKCKRRN